MCKHSALDWLAKKARDQIAKEEMRHCLEEFDYDAEKVLQGREYHDLLHNAIEKLPPKRKLIFRLCKIDGISYDKVAEQLEVSPGTINDHIVKGTRFVKEYLKLCGISHIL